MKKIRKLICAIVCVFSVIALGACDLQAILGGLLNNTADINYYIDGEFFGYIEVNVGDEIILNLDDIYVEDDETLHNHIHTILKENQEFDYWYIDNAYTTKAVEGTPVEEDVNLYGRIVDKTLAGGEVGGETPSTGIVDNVVYEDLQLHFLELGNSYSGDCTYIKAGDVDILIDAGSRQGSATTIKAYLDQYVIDGKLEYVIATHAHQDHIAGFVGNKSGDTRTGILYQYEIGTLIDFSLTDVTSQLYGNYLTAVEYCVEKGTTHYTADQCWEETGGASRSYNLTDEISLNILYNKYYFEEASDENDYSVCTLISYNDHHFMLTGDLELEGEEALAEYYDGSTPEKTLPHCVLFKGGHHGSGSSTNDCLLSLITPEIVTICTCAGSTEYTANYLNIFPTQAMITRVAKYTDRVYVTTVFNEQTGEEESMNGNIVISSNSTAIGVSASNNITKLKDTAWFNQTVYVVYDSKNNPLICSGSGKEDFYTAETEGAVALPRRVWPE